MDLKSIVEQYDIDYTKNRVDEKFISEMENAIGMQVGSELKAYIIDYGYIGYEHIEFYGVYSNMLLQSDMITQTQYIHKYFEKTRECVAFENPGEGDYIIVDANDKVYEYISETDELVDLNQSLFEYICNRFEQV